MTDVGVLVTWEDLLLKAGKLIPSLRYGLNWFSRVKFIRSVDSDSSAADHPSAESNLAMYFGHTARLGSKLWDHNDMSSFYKVLQEHNRTSTQVMDQQLFSIMNTWWWGTLKPMLEEAAATQDKGIWIKTLRRLDDFNCTIHDVWGPALRKTKESVATEAAISVYDQTFGRIQETIELLKSLQWDVDWKRPSKLGV